MASRLFALEGVQVAEVDEEPGGGRTVWVVTADPQARGVPGCGTVSAQVRGRWRLARRILRHGRDQIAVRVGEAAAGSAGWLSCPRKTFTESLPAVPPRCRVTARLRDHAGRLVAEGGRTVAQAARECGLSWPVAHEAFAAQRGPAAGAAARAGGAPGDR